MGKKVKGNKPPKKLQLLTSNDLVNMTDNFSEKNFIGTFQFGKLYRGFLKDRDFTIKIWVPPSSEYSTMQNHECRLMDELIMLRHQRLVHPCIVRLYGYCRDKDHLAVVYNLKAMDSLLNLFLKEDFTWAQRIKVALSFSYLLKFFHDKFGDLDPFVIRNLSPAHVILDEEYNPMLVDFSMITGGIFPNRHVYTFQPAYGCVGYWDGEIFQGGEHLGLWTEKSDVFAFGVMLLSLLSKKVLNLEMSDEPFYVEDWAHAEYEEDCKSLVHESLQADPGFYAIDGSELSKLGVDCTSDNRIDRPTMKKVVEIISTLRVCNDHRKLLGLEKLFYLNKKLHPTVSLDMEKSKKLCRDTQIDSFSFSMTKDIWKCKVSDLRRLTNKFSEDNYIGRFQFGKLYRGVYNSICVGVRYLVVKIWDDCQTLEDNILRLGDEMLLLHHERYICHPGLARMFGYCIEDEYVAIVLYFEPMDSIRNLLPKDDFTWMDRIKAACGVASLLKFLHDVSHRMDPFIIRNLDVAHILLDKDCNPKLFDLGHITGGIYPNRPMDVVKVNLVGHDDQVEPTYDISGIITGTWTTKNDVFSFGVLLLCLISKRSNVASLVYDSGWLATSNDIETLVHERLQKDPTYDEDDGKEITKLVFQCVQTNPEYRPTMCDVLVALEKLHGVEIDADVMYAENMFHKKCAIESENALTNMPKKHFMSDN